MNLRLVCLFVLGALALSAGMASAASYTAVATGNWSSTNVWSPAGIPGAADDVSIPSGFTVTYNNVAGTPATVGPVNVGGGLVINKASGTFGDFNIEAGGTMTFSSQVAITFSGNFTNNGTFNPAGQSQNALTTYSGAGKVIAGVVSNQVVNITGSYHNLGTLVTAVNAQNGTLQGTGTLVNDGTIIHKGSGPIPFTSLTASAGSTFIWAGINNSSQPLVADSFYNLILGNTGSAGFNLAAVTVTGNLTITNTGPISTWPSGNTVGGVLNYLCTGNTTTVPAAGVSIGGLNQTAGTIALAANGTLTVTGSGATAWNRTGGSFNTAVGSTVKFTGSAPVIGGSASNRFANLVVDATATNASVTGILVVTNGLTVAAGASLDVSAIAPYSLTVTQLVFNSGTIKGDVTTAANSRAKIFGGTDGAFGTATISGSLSLGSSNSVNLDLDTTAAATQDKVVVGTTATLNSTIVNLKAPSAGAAIDTANDYILLTAAGGISGTPVLHWVTAPADSGNYNLVVDGNNLKLHYGGVVVGSPRLSITNNSGTLSLSWDAATFPGYNLQSQTNASGVSSTGWGDITAADATPASAPADTANGSVFYRLIKP